MIVVGKLARDDIRSAAMNPASNGRPGDTQFGEEVPVPGFANCFLNPVAVGPSRVNRFHLERIGRRLR